MNKRTILFALLAIVAIGGGYALKEFNRSAVKADEMPVKETISAPELLSAFASDEPAATARFVGATEQVIQVSGTIRAIDPVDKDRTNVVLATDDDLAGIVCEFATADMPPNWRSGAAVNVRGICTGMLMDVVLVRCVGVE